MESTVGVAGKPVYAILVLASFVLAGSGYGYAVSRHALDVIADTGSPIVPSHAFYWVQVLVLLSVGLYIYRLWSDRCDVHANFMRVPVLLTLTLLGVAWILLGHHQLPWATTAVGAGLVVIMFSLLVYTTKTTHMVTTQSHPLDVVTPYLPPQMTSYGYVIATSTTLAGWMAILFYVFLVATLFDSNAISSTGAAADILIAYLALLIIPASICYSLVNEPFVVWLTLITIARNIEGSALHAVVWAGIGILSALVYCGIRDRFSLMSRYHFME